MPSFRPTDLQDRSRWDLIGARLKNLDFYRTLTKQVLPSKAGSSVQFTPPPKFIAVLCSRSAHVGCALANPGIECSRVLGWEKKNSGVLAERSGYHGCHQFCSADFSDLIIYLYSVALFILGAACHHIERVWFQGGIPAAFPNHCAEQITSIQCTSFVYSHILFFSCVLRPITRSRDKRFNLNVTNYHYYRIFNYGALHASFENSFRPRSEGGGMISDTTYHSLIFSSKWL
jgi:hypothetical protein